MEGVWSDDPKLFICPDRKPSISRAHNHLEPRHLGRNGLNTVFAVLANAFGNCLNYSSLEQFAEASRYIGEAMTKIETTEERWCEAEVNRVTGEIAVKSSEKDVVKAEVYFERALTVARAQQAKSWELRAAISMARLWRDQGKREEAYDLLAPVYGWFTEGFDTLDLKEAKALLDKLAA